MKRIKRRYLALQLETSAVPTEREFIDAVWSSVVRFYGEVGASQTGLSLISLDGERSIAVIRVSLATLNMVRSSLAAITALCGREASVRTLAVSGTLKALYSSLK